MKTLKLLAFAGLFLASLVASQAQLITTTVASSIENIVLRSESPHVLNTGALHLGADFVSSPDIGVVFDSAIPFKHAQYLDAASDPSALLWTKAYAAPVISLSEGYVVDVTFIRGVGATFLNTFGVTYSGDLYGNKNLFTAYNASTNLNTLRLSSDDNLDLNFWAFNLNIGQEYVGSLYFDVYTAFDFTDFSTHYIIGVNNLLSQQGFCFADSIIEVTVYGTPINPEIPEIPQNPVPEPSTYGLIGAAGLMGLIALRRRSKK